MGTESFDVNRKWLVKSSGRVIGPYRQEEILHLLLEKRIAPIDEIKGPETRWVFLREHSQFREIVQKYRDQESNSIENTQGGNNTATETDVTDDLTPTPHPLHLTGNKSSSSVPEIKAAAKMESTFKKQATPHYGMLNDRRVIRRTESKAKIVVTSLLIAGMVLLFFSGYIYLNKKTKIGAKVLTPQNYKESAIKNKALGLYDLALADYRKAKEKESLDLVSKLALANLLMCVENNYLEANRLLDEIESEHKNLTSEYKSIIENIRGLAAMSEDRFTASEIHFKNAINFDASNELAKINLVQLRIIYGKTSEALKLIQDLSKEGLNSAIFLINRAFLTVNGKNDTDKFVKLDQELGQMPSTEFKTEVRLLRTYLNFKLNKKDGFVSNLNSLFNINPDISRNYVRELGISYRALEWSRFKSLCDEMISAGGDNSWAKALDIYCSYQKGDLNGASVKGDAYSVKYANDDHITGIYLFLLFKTNRIAEAKAIISLKQNNDIYLLNEVQAEICLKEGDYICAEEKFSNMYHNDAKDIESIYGLTRSHYFSGDKDGALAYMQKGLLLADRFLPLVQLKEKLNE